MLFRSKVVPISGYNRSRPEALEVRPSPGLRSLHAIRAYPSLALFEPTTISLGRGTDHPYEVFGVPSPPLGTFSFTPSASAPLYPGQLCFGVEFFSRPISDIPRFTTDIFTNAIRAVGAKSAIKDRHFLEQLTGNLQVVNRMIEGHPWEEIRKDLAEKLLNFRRKRAPYLLYSP